MQTEIQYGVRYFANGYVYEVANAFEANLVYKRLYDAQIAAEVVCRRITYGVWTTPRVKLLTGG